MEYIIPAASAIVVAIIEEMKRHELIGHYFTEVT